VERLRVARGARRGGIALVAIWQTHRVFVLVALATIGAIGFVALPRIGFWLARHPGADRATFLPWISALLFVVAWRLPNPDLAGTSTFTQHAVGGGAACAVLGTYIALNVGLRSSLLRIGLAYGVAASMGAANEVLELGYDHLQGTSLSADSSWDLLANSAGAVGTAVLIELIIVSSGLVRRPGAALRRPRVGRR
jgi:hypothetical protein